MASSSADCVFGVVRLISSASRKLVKIGPGLELELLGVRVIDGDAEHVAGQHVAGELQAVEAAGDRSRQRLRQRGFAHARHVFDQQMPARQQAASDRRTTSRFPRIASPKADSISRNLAISRAGKSAVVASIDSRWGILFMILDGREGAASRTGHSGSHILISRGRTRNVPGRYRNKKAPRHSGVEHKGLLQSVSEDDRPALILAFTVMCKSIQKATPNYRFRNRKINVVVPLPHLVLSGTVSVWLLEASPRARPTNSVDR